MAAVHTMRPGKELPKPKKKEPMRGVGQVTVDELLRSLAPEKLRV
jgi:hypothetical protein